MRILAAHNLGEVLAAGVRAVPLLVSDRSGIPGAEGTIRRILAAAGLGPAPRRSSPAGRRFTFLLRDRDTKFTAAFDDLFSGNGTRIINTPVPAPRANAFAERFVGTLRRECLDHMLIFGTRHLRKVLAEFACHYDEHRPHQSLQQEPPRSPGRTVDITARIERKQVFGGLINEYRRAA